MKKTLISSLVIATTLSFPAFADDYVITLKDHEFSPKELSIPADQKVTIIVKNETAKPMEFESHSLKREKVIGANKEAKIIVGPLAAGSYEYFDEFHEESKGSIVVK